ncbi:hypothetical protein HanRHA438_Chr13g0588391 [Helianthus annuus]|nr:hypothetical protein HanRHA438_Chr13g0588391 [Helianthus annuus]
MGIYTHNRYTGRRIRMSGRKIIYLPETHRRIHIYLEGWYILRGPTASIESYLSSSSKDINNPSMTSFDTTYVTNMC